MVWTLADSNRSPLPCHGSALPDELKAQLSILIVLQGYLLCLTLPEDTRRVPYGGELKALQESIVTDFKKRYILKEEELADITR